MLPCDILATTFVSKSKMKGYFTYRKWKDIKGRIQHQIKYCNHSSFAVEEVFLADTEANAKAKMLVYLIKNKLMEVPK